MYHYMLDSYNCFRSRLEDITLIYEILERIPYVLGVKTVMPPFILPYYNGVVPEDCGISGFVFLNGGHFTIHTFSYRECYYVDFFSPVKYNQEELKKLITKALPSNKVMDYSINRLGNINKEIFNPIDKENDFGPHMFFEIDYSKENISMDSIFSVLDNMPKKIGMTPIMRPYIIKTREDNNCIIYSALTMIAESHISIHYFEKKKKAYFDIFSCKFFDEEYVIPRIFDLLSISKDTPYQMISRGSKYSHYKKTGDNKLDYSTQWLKNIKS